MRSHHLIIGVAAVLGLGLTGGSAVAQGIDLGAMDQRALQPPIDMTQQQLQAQRPPPAFEGRSVAVPFWQFQPDQREYRR
jgi:hypothetical protein